MDREEIKTLILDHQWLGPASPRRCLCGWKGSFRPGSTSRIEQHAEHVTEEIFQIDS